jgi:hypothetical protein
MIDQTSLKDDCADRPRKSGPTMAFSILGLPSSSKPNEVSRDCSSLKEISEDEDEFNKTLVQDLVERLNGQVEIALTAHDKALLAIIVEGTYEVCPENVCVTYS